MDQGQLHLPPRLLPQAQLCPRSWETGNGHQPGGCPGLLRQGQAEALVVWTVSPEPGAEQGQGLLPRPPTHAPRPLLQHPGRPGGEGAGVCPGSGVPEPLDAVIRPHGAQPKAPVGRVPHLHIASLGRTQWRPPACDSSWPCCPGPQLPDPLSLPGLCGFARGTPASPGAGAEGTQWRGPCPVGQRVLTGCVCLPTAPGWSSVQGWAEQALSCPLLQADAAPAHTQATGHPSLLGRPSALWDPWSPDPGPGLHGRPG